MVFSTIIFLLRFLPITLALYYLAPPKLKNTVLFLCSLVFYCWGEVRFFPVMLALILINYLCGLGRERFEQNKTARLILLLIALACVEWDAGWKSAHLILFGLFGCGSFVLGAAVCCLAVQYTRGEDLLPPIFKLILGLVAAVLSVRLTGSTVWGAAAAMAGITVGTLFAVLYTRIYAKLKGAGITAEMLENSPEPQSGAAALKKMILLTLPIALTSLTFNIPPMIDALTVKSGLEGLINGGTDLREIYRSVFENGDMPDLSAFPVLLYGIRGKAYTVFNLVPAFTSVIGVGAVPAIAAAAARGNTAELKKNINTVLKTAALISLPAACGLIAIGGRITDFLYDTEASAVIGGEMLTLYGFAALFAGFLVPLGGILQAVGRQNAVLLNTAVGTAVKLIVNIIAVSVPKINVMGSALGTVLCCFVIFLLDIAVLIKAVGFAPDSVNVFLKPLASAVFCGLAARLTVMLGSSRGVTLLAVFAAALVYAALIIALYSVSESDFPDSDKGKKLAEFCRKHRIIR